MRFSLIRFLFRRRTAVGPASCPRLRPVAEAIHNGGTMPKVILDDTTITALADATVAILTTLADRPVLLAAVLLTAMVVRVRE